MSLLGGQRPSKVSLPPHLDPVYESACSGGEAVLPPHRCQVAHVLLLLSPFRVLDRLPWSGLTTPVSCPCRYHH
jgi:hypothetical protein